jgi:ATP-dependent RNA helicase DHX57
VLLIDCTRLDTDFLLCLLKELLPRRNSVQQGRGGKASKGPSHPLRVVLMSATMEGGLFERYFSTAPCSSRAPPRAPPALKIPGRTFPVEEYFVEDVVRMTGYR